MCKLVDDYAKEFLIETAKKLFAMNLPFEQVRKAIDADLVSTEELHAIEQAVEEEKIMPQQS